ncbi:MAG: hypothetical protein AB7W59_02215 [Acidimicrobiia bacterium]
MARRSRRPARVPRAATNGHILHRPHDPALDYWRRATCAEVECPGYVHGFVLRIDETTPLGQAQAAYLRADTSRRRAREYRDEAGLTVFQYAPGQRCTSDADDAHRVPVEREPLFILRDPRQGRRQVEPMQWVDTLHENVDRFATLRARG